MSSRRMSLKAMWWDLCYEREQLQFKRGCVCLLGAKATLNQISKRRQKVTFNQRENFENLFDIFGRNKNKGNVEKIDNWRVLLSLSNIHVSKCLQKTDKQIDDDVNVRCLINPLSYLANYVEKKKTENTLYWLK